MCLEQEHKSRSKNTKLKSKNHKPRNTNTNINPATYIPCQPNTKTINPNANPNISKKWVQGADYNGFLQIRFLWRPGPTLKRWCSRTEPRPKSKPKFELGLYRDFEFHRIDQNDCVEIEVSDLDLPAWCREFGYGLKKETLMIREVMSRAVMDFPTSLDTDASIPQKSFKLVS